MRQTISGMVAAVAVMMTAGTAPAMACGGGLFQSSCSPCAYSAPCAPAPVYVEEEPVCRIVRKRFIDEYGYERVRRVEVCN